jgi:hypothetical protein
MRDTNARHLATPLPLHRRWQLWTAVGVAVLLVITAAAWIGPQAEPDRPSAAPSVTGAGASTTTAAAAGTTTPSPQTPTGEGPKNLLANASFEDGSLGWQPLGGAHLAKTTEAREGGYSLRISAGPSTGGPVGITVPDVTLTKLGGRYHTNAWVRPSSPNTTVTIGLREYLKGKPVPGSNTLGWTVERTGWRQFGAIHVASQRGSRLVLEITARDLPPGGYLDIDEVVLHLLPSR